MSKKSELLKLIPEQGIVPLYYAESARVSINIMKALYEGGIMTTEYADRGGNALLNFIEMRKFCDRELPGMRLGIGTIKNAQSARTYINEGAEFIVCPGIIEEVNEISEENNVLCIPGCMTPTDLIKAEEAGARVIKLFPANTLTPSFLDTMADLFKDLLFIPTGGIELNENNLTSWFKRGVCAVGGSKMITRDTIDHEQYEKLSSDSSDALELIRSVRNSLRNPVPVTAI